MEWNGFRQVMSSGVHSIARALNRGLFNQVIAIERGAGFNRVQQIHTDLVP